MIYRDKERLSLLHLIFLIKIVIFGFLLTLSIILLIFKLENRYNINIISIIIVLSIYFSLPIIYFLKINKNQDHAYYYNLICLVIDVLLLNFLIINIYSVYNLILYGGYLILIFLGSFFLINKAYLKLCKSFKF